MEKDDDLIGMDQEVFAAAPPEAMRKLLQVGGGVGGFMGRLRRASAPATSGGGSAASLLPVLLPLRHTAPVCLRSTWSTGTAASGGTWRPLALTRSSRRSWRQG